MVEYIVKMGKPYDIGKALHYFNVPFVEIRRAESPWHTGTPTEGGLFLVYLKDGTYDIYEFGKEYTAWDIGFSDVVAWQKIEHYKEKEK